MKSYFYIRSFLFQKRDKLDNFIQENAAWEEIHDLFMKYKNIGGGLDVSALEMMNEVCFQCAQAVLKRNLLRNIWADYCYPDCESPYCPATPVCLSLVYAVLSLTEFSSWKKKVLLGKLKRHLCSHYDCKLYFWRMDDYLRGLKREYRGERMFTWKRQKGEQELPFSTADFLTVPRRNRTKLGFAPENELRELRRQNSRYLAKLEEQIAMTRKLDVLLQTKRVNLINAASHTQYNYHAGAVHISENQIKGIHISTTPDELTSQQE